MSKPSPKKKAKRYCIAPGCRNTNINWEQFFALPLHGMDTLRRREWLTLLAREDLLEKKSTNYFVCSAHFDTSSTTITRKLKKGAVPTLVVQNELQDGSSSKSTEGTSWSAVTSTSTQTVKQKVSNKLFKEHTGSQTNEQDLSDNHSQTSKLLTEATEDSQRKRKLSCELPKCKREKRTPDREIIKIKQELEAKNKPITCNDPDDEITKRFQKLIDWQNKIKNKYNRNRYDAEYKLFALNLHYSSPQAYRCLQTVLTLPCKSTLSRFKINIPPKLDNRVLDILALKLKSLPEAAKYCTLCIDEMSLKRNLCYNIKRDEVIGFQNINGKITPEIASNAFVIMLQGIYVNWKQPIAYALLATAKHYEEIDTWMNEVISKLSQLGIKVKAIISDQGSNFDKFAKEVKKVTIDNPYFLYDGNKIYYIFHVPHLIKCIRNILLTSDFIIDGKKISWEYIAELYKDQKDRKLRLIPKITDAHIHPNSFHKTRVKLAVQTLSRTVSAALHTYIDLGKMSEEARPTAAFIESMNNLFDVLNASKIKSDSQFQRAFRMSKDQENLLNAAKGMFSDIKALDRKTGTNNTGHIKSFVNFQISIQSIIMLYEDLQKDGFTYLLTRRLNQDNLEHFLSSVRQQGSCSEPTSLEFQRAFSKLFVCNMMKNAQSTNCEMDICDILAKAEEIKKIKLTCNDLPKHTSSAINLNGETDYRIDLPDENSLIYVSGYLFSKCLNKHNCSTIDNVTKSDPGCHETDLLSKYKAFNQKSGLYSSLKMPPKEFIEYITKLETIFTQNFGSLVQNHPGGKLLELFQGIPPQVPCSCFPLDYLFKLFARLRIFETIKFNNRLLKDSKKGIKIYLKLSHLQY